jgi:hypothetical protein
MMAHAMPNAAFTLRTGIAQGKMVYIGKGGDIDGKANPILSVHEGDIVQITIVNGEGAEHDIVLPDLHAASQRVSSPGASSTLTFRASDIGSFSCATAPCSLGISAIRPSSWLGQAMRYLPSVRLARTTADRSARGCWSATQTSVRGIFAAGDVALARST